MTATPPRTIKLIRPTSIDGVGVFRITVGRAAHHYAFRELRCDIGGRGFAVHRLGLGPLYHVRVGPPRDCSCECLGFLYRSKCRHILGLRALIREGLVGPARPDVGGALASGRAGPTRHITNHA